MVPKKGKQRRALKTTMKKAMKTTKKAPMKKPLKSMKCKYKAPKNVKYVRHGIATQVSRLARKKWGCSVKDLMNKGERHVVKTLQDANILPEWKGKTCPHCNKGVLGPMKVRADTGRLTYRCNLGRECGKHVCPHAFHPIFHTGWGSATVPLEDQAVILFCTVAGCSYTAAGRIVPNSEKTVQLIYRRLYATRSSYVVWKEKKIRFGEGEAWKDVEADEVDLGKAEDPDAKPNAKKPMIWEQWGGLVERGAPQTLVLFKLKPVKTKKRAPGPGPITKRDWKPISTKWLKGRKVILHTDGARTYKMDIDGVEHDYAVHKEKKVTIKGRTFWMKPKFSKVFYHNVETIGGKSVRLWVKTGTQIIDRAWGMLRNHVGRLNTGPNSVALNHRIRSFQWEYWNRGKDMWIATGDMIQALFEKNFKTTSTDF